MGIRYRLELEPGKAPRETLIECRLRPTPNRVLKADEILSSVFNEEDKYEFLGLAGITRMSWEYIVEEMKVQEKE